jgi:hypothetical protein
MDKKMAELTGLEPAVFGLTGRRVKPTALQLRNNAIMVGGTGLEPMTSGL